MKENKTNILVRVDVSDIMIPSCFVFDYSSVSWISQYSISRIEISATGKRQRLNRTQREFVSPASQFREKRKMAIATDEDSACDVSFLDKIQDRFSLVQITSPTISQVEARIKRHRTDNEFECRFRRRQPLQQSLILLSSKQRFRFGINFGAARAMR